MPTTPVHGTKRNVMILMRLLTGETLTKQALAVEYGCSPSAVQRDFRRIRVAAAEAGLADRFQVVQRGKGQYVLAQQSQLELEPIQTLALCQILLASRGLTAPEMAQLLAPLMTAPAMDQAVRQTLKSDLTAYKGVPAAPILPKLVLIVNAIQRREQLTFTYSRNGQRVRVTRVPSAVFFSDLYFFMTSANENSYDDLDVRRLNKFAVAQMQDIEVVGRSADSSRKAHLEPGVLRQHTALPFLGAPVVLVIDYFSDPQYVRDRFPQAKVVQATIPSAEQPTWPGWTGQAARIEISVNDGYGVRMWLLQQAHMVKVVAPTSLRDYVETRMRWALAAYSK